MVDTMKKYRRDSPSGVFTHLDRRDAPHPMGSGHPEGHGEYKLSRKTLLVFLIILLYGFALHNKS